MGHYSFGVLHTSTMKYLTLSRLDWPSYLWHCQCHILCHIQCPILMLYPTMLIIQHLLIMHQPSDVSKSKHIVDHQKEMDMMRSHPGVSTQHNPRMTLVITPTTKRYFVCDKC